ncbi:hypothetical protein TeGR_g13002, partial [Tetraparma gracilis]
MASWGAYVGKGMHGRGSSERPKVRSFPGDPTYGKSKGESGSRASSSEPAGRPPASNKQWQNKKEFSSYHPKAQAPAFDPAAFRAALRNDPPRVTASMSAALGFDRSVFESDEDLRQLNGEQRAIVEAVVFGGQSCFFTGPAGTGKSK